MQFSSQWAASQRARLERLVYHIKANKLNYLNKFLDFWYLIFPFIIWLCLTRTGNYKIHEFDWLKSILTAV